jgi:Fe-S cluster assembly protein SufD
MTQTLAGRDLFLAEFARLESALGADGRAWLAPLRREAIARFEQMGFPTMRQEEWRQTNVQPLAQIAFRPAEPPASVGEIPTEILLEELGGPRLVFVNGRFDASRSTLKSLPRGVKLLSLAEALDSERPALEPHLAKIASHDHPFAALNTAFFHDGAFLHIPRRAVLENPIHLLFLTVPGPEPTVTHPRVLVVAEDESQAKVIESHAGLGAGIYFTDVVTEIAAGESTVLRHLKVQREGPEAFHIDNLATELGRAANFTAQTINLGGALTRNDLRAVLDGEGIECNLHGLTLVTGKQHVDNHTKIEHAKPHCYSRQFYKAVLDERATSVFNGRIHVHPDAQKTDAIQSNRSLLLADTATAHAQPQLEIYADDVRCTHGATIGAIDEDAIFYLQSRGISKAEARSLLTYAFANEIIERIEIAPLRERLEQLIYHRFEGEFNPTHPQEHRP